MTLTLTKRAARLVAAVLITAAGASLLSRADRVDAAPTDMHLSSTLFLATGDELRNKHIIWEGPAGSPILHLRGVQFAVLDHLFIEVAAGHSATAAIQLDDNPPNGGPFNNDLRNIRIGTPANPGGFNYGLRWDGTMNGDSNAMTNIAVYGAGVASISIGNPQATVNTFRSIFSHGAPIGFQTNNGGTIQCDNCGFANSTDVDVAMTDGARVIFTGVRSTGARSFARVTAGNAAGGLTVVGGTWQWGPNASGATVTGVQPGQFPTSLRLQDFTVTPLDGTAHGSIAGFTQYELYLSNVAGIA